MNVMKNALGALMRFADARPRIFLAALALLAALPGISAIPPLDRDESRFAQATKQMLETGDFIEIRFQDEARNKKPVGIYWLQAASVMAFGHVENGRVEAGIWAWRVPSVIGAVIAVLFCFQAGLVLFGHRTALWGAALFAVTALMVGEAHIAKTDAVLAACITAMMAALARVFMDHRKQLRAPAATAFLFWAALGTGLLIKGPVAFMVAGFAIAWLAIREKGARWLMALRPLWGVPLALLMVAPWAIAITIETDGAFWTEAIFGDLAPKLAGGQEKHWGPPGYYLATFFIMFFPGTLLILPAVRHAWQQRKNDAIIFLIAWIVPGFLVFEAIPTKLPHYVLPLYPAFALLIADFLVRPRGPELSGLRRANIALWLLIALAFAAAITLLPAYMGQGPGIPDYVLTVILAALAMLAALLAAMREDRKALATAGVMALALYAAATMRSVHLVDSIQISSRVAAALHAAYPDGLPPVATAGFSEPSLVFLTATTTRLGRGTNAAAFLAETQDGVVAAESRRQEEFLAECARLGVAVESFGEVRGVNYSRGDNTVITLYRRKSGT